MILRFTISKLNASQHFRRALARFTTGLPKGWKTFVFVGQMQILLQRILVTNYGGHASSQSRPKPRPARKWRSCGVKKCKLRPRERSPIFCDCKTSLLTKRDVMPNGKLMPSQLQGCPKPWERNNDSHSN